MSTLTLFLRSRAETTRCSPGPPPNGAYSDLDKDFGERVYRGGAAHAGIIRLSHVPSAQHIALIEQLLADHSPNEIEGAIVTVRGARVRISRSKA